VRRAGHAVVLVTGRPEAEVEPTVLSRFDGVVLEGGAVWGSPGRLQRAPEAAIALAAARRLQEAGVEVDARTASFSAWVKDAEAVARLAADCHVVRNVDRFDVLPPGHDKSTGLAALLAPLGLQGRPLVATGDGENDAALLRRSTLGLAVGNATPMLRRHAHHVLPGDGPAGIRLVARLLLEPTA
jgi:hydroxymethylpyrimidine pyrophosphatase-like HAD family hydrolase